MQAFFTEGRTFFDRGTDLFLIRCLIALRAAEAAGELDDVQRLLFAKTRAPEELYDLAADPWEVRNLAADPAHAATLLELRTKLDRWMVQTNDQGRTPRDRGALRCRNGRVSGEQTQARGHQEHRPDEKMGQGRQVARAYDTMNPKRHLFLLELGRMFQGEFIARPATWTSRARC